MPLLSRISRAHRRSNPPPPAQPQQQQQPPSNPSPPNNRTSTETERYAPSIDDTSSILPSDSISLYSQTTRYSSTNDEESNPDNSNTHNATTTDNDGSLTPRAGSPVRSEVTALDDSTSPPNSSVLTNGSDDNNNNNNNNTITTTTNSPSSEQLTSQTGGYRGFPTEEAYLTALKAWAEERSYIWANETMSGYYGAKTMSDYAAVAPPSINLELGLGKRWRARRKSRRVSSAADGSSVSSSVVSGGGRDSSAVDDVVGEGSSEGEGGGDRGVRRDRVTGVVDGRREVVV